MKIKEEELEMAKNQHERLQKAISKIGVLETQKHGLLHEIASINTEIEDFKKELEKKYGHVEINLTDGTYTKVEESEKDKKD
jgi:vacuolar-type H+-ATPase subunit D/Vma8